MWRKDVLYAEYGKAMMRMSYLFHLVQVHSELDKSIRVHKEHDFPGNIQEELQLELLGTDINLFNIATIRCEELNKQFSDTLDLLG